MNKTQKSSRKRMDSRLKGYRKQTPALLRRPAPGDIEQVIEVPNRAKRLHDVAAKRGAQGQSVREEMNNQRKDIQTKARRELRKIRKETQAAMRKAAGQ